MPDSPSHGSTGEREVLTSSLRSVADRIAMTPVQIEDANTIRQAASQLDQVREERDEWRGKAENRLSEWRLRVDDVADAEATADEAIAAKEMYKARADKLQARVEELEGQGEELTMIALAVKNVSLPGTDLEQVDVERGVELLIEEHYKLKARVEECADLRNALEKFGRHTDDCESRCAGRFEDDCGCGFRTALATSPPNGEQP
jgi:chromosome segregation ATPase